MALDFGIVFKGKKTSFSRINTVDFHLWDYFGGKCSCPIASNIMVLKQFPFIVHKMHVVVPNFSHALKCSE